MKTKYTVSDGVLMLTLEPAEEGGYCVTSPLDPQLVTQAETLEEAFEMAYDARETLTKARAELASRLLRTSPGPDADSGSPQVTSGPARA